MQIRVSELESIDLWGDDFDRDEWFIDEETVLEDVRDLLPTEASEDIVAEVLSEVFEVPSRNVTLTNVFVTTNPRFHSANGNSELGFRVKTDLGVVFVECYFNMMEITENF